VPSCEDQAKSHTVSFTVETTDSDRLTTTQTLTIEVASGPTCNNPPTARSGGPDTGTVGQPVSFNGNASSDLDNDTLTWL
jgi:hypothetical protein